MELTKEEIHCLWGYWNNFYEAPDRCFYTKMSGESRLKLQKIGLIIIKDELLDTAGDVKQET